MTKESTQAEAKGKCLCGSVQFQIQGEMRDVVNCHCSKCRKFHGNFSAYTWARVENLEYIKQDGLKWFKSIEDETPGVYRGFCSECDSSLFWHPKESPMISIAAGALDTPSNLKTIGHIWCSQIADYYQIEDNLPKYMKRWDSKEQPYK